MAINFPSSPTLYQIFNTVDNSFIWNGTAWVGYSTSLVVNYNASSVVIQDDNSIVGATTSINFGDNLTVSAISAGIVTVTGSASGSSSQFVTTAAGIHTLSNVGIGTTNPTSKLTVTGNVSIVGVATITGDALINGLTVGRGSGYVIDESTAIGRFVLISNTSGGFNVGVGHSALYSNTTGSENSGIGYRSLYSNTTGYTNVAVGREALYYNTTGNQNTGAGVAALYYNTTGYLNTGAGVAALYYNTTGYLNTAIGVGAGQSITTGSRNTLLGSYTGNQNGLDIRTSNNNVVLSDGDGNIRFYANSSGNVGLGTTNPTSALTVGAVGAATTNLVVNGWANIGGIDIRQSSDKSLYIGEGAGQSNINVGDFRNVAIGYEVLNQNTGGDYNVVIGSGAMKYGTGNYNVIIGNNAGDDFDFSGTSNVFIGAGVGGNATSADDNTIVGNSAGGALISGDKNSFYGDDSGDKITTGSKNTLLGSYDGNQNGLDIRTSSNNVVLSDGDGNIRFYANSSGNVGIGTTNPTEKLTVVGVTSSTLFYGDASYTTSGRWTLGASGINDYTFTGIGFTQTTNDPVLYLARGRVYEFVNNSGGSHPFQIRVSNGGAAYSDGVTNNSAASGVIRFEVPFNAPNTLYYQCTNHSGMGNTISVYPSTI